MATATKPTRAKRHRETWPSREIYHVWAHQRASYGRAQGVNVFFDGPVIFSYGRHFPMAKLLLKRGQPVAVLVTTQTYSTTTAGHMSDVRSAVNHLPSFHVRDVTETDHRKNFADYRKRIEATADAVSRAKSATLHHIDSLDRLIAEANDYAVYFGLATRFGYPKGFDVGVQRERGRVEAALKAERDAGREARDRDKRAAALAEARAKYPAEFAEYEATLKLWLDGQGNEFPQRPRDPDNPYQYVREPARLRVRGSRIETSQGAVVSVAAAVPLLALIRAGGEGVIPLPEGFKIDGYSGGRLDHAAKVVTIGCHEIAFAEVERVAAVLGL